MFKMKYEIKQDFLPSPSKRRSGKKIDKVGFQVAHDTGNDGSTARQNVSYYKNSAQTDSASAHIFVDDKEIIECIPAFKNPEKAWHVLYEKPKDNQLFGDDANDIALGVELCFSNKKGSIVNEEAYKRYVWVLAYICYTYNLNPLKHITGHFILDPERKTDPVNALSKYGKTYEGLLQDVNKELIDCTSVVIPPPPVCPKWNNVPLKKGQIGKLIILKSINLWKRVDGNLRMERILNPGESYPVYGFDNQFGGQFNVGGFYVTNMKDYVKYEAPSKDLIDQANKFYGL